jgi:hypothetical protein
MDVMWVSDDVTNDTGEWKEKTCCADPKLIATGKEKDLGDPWLRTLSMRLEIQGCPLLGSRLHTRDS